MKIKSVAGITCYVKNLEKTASFYEMIGFLRDKHEGNSLSVRLNWFWINFILDKEKTVNNKEIGISVYLSVDDVDGYYNELLAHGIKPASEPQDLSGNREFVISDPDGYKLVIFKRK